MNIFIKFCKMLTNFRGRDSAHLDTAARRARLLPLHHSGAGDLKSVVPEKDAVGLSPNSVDRASRTAFSL